MTEERWPHDPVLHAWWVIPGRLLAGEYPNSTTPQRAVEKMRLLVEAGVNPAEAFDRIERARGCPVPDTLEQRVWVERYQQSHTDNPRTLFLSR